MPKRGSSSAIQGKILLFSLYNFNDYQLFFNNIILFALFFLETVISVNIVNLVLLYIIAYYNS